MKARKSIFIPRKAPMKEKQDLDLSGAKLKGNSDDEDDHS